MPGGLSRRTQEGDLHASLGSAQIAGDAVGGDKVVESSLAKGITSLDVSPPPPASTA